MVRPLIGITGRRWPASYLGANLPSAMSELAFDLHFSDYPHSVALAGGVPMELTRDADVNDTVAYLDGLVLTGGADLEPALYNETPEESLGPVEPDRDEWEIALLAGARAKGVPILGICRGLQLVNVAFGGTLRQHVELSDGAGHPQWNVNGRRPTHEVYVVRGSASAQIYPPEISVNSLHHQVVKDVGEGLVVSARASDGVVEGLETPDGQILAVQWHPELLPAPDASFHWLVRSARAYQVEHRA